MFRLSLTRILFTISLLLLLLLLWNLYHNNHPNYQNTCDATIEYQNDLEELLKRVKTVLDKLTFTNFLCYGSLWGEIRISRMFPWSQKAEICILDEQRAHIKPDHFYNTFTENNLHIEYVASEGYYIVKSNRRNESAYPFVEMYVFAKDRELNVYKRVGWYRNLLPPYCEWTPSLHCFPTHLIDDLPLPQRRVGKYAYSVPRGGIDLQKFHYPDNWWLEIKTRNC